MRRGRFQLFWLIGFALALSSGCGDAEELNLHDANFDAGFDGIAAVCGDGLLEGEEECDDGNTEPGDGCSPDCRLERPSCAEDASVCSADEFCLDGECVIKECASDADCGAPDGCALEVFCDEARFFCVREPAKADGERCEHTSGALSECSAGECEPIGCETTLDCDDGLVCNGEERCEAGRCFGAESPAEDGTHCANGGRCVGALCMPPACASDADCEDENECREEARCDLTILQCVAGDARVGAACDGAVCDSGVCEPGVCDPAGECVPTGCGNGILESGEQCDDWNLENGDGCSSRCRIETAFRVQQIELVDPHFHSFAHLSGSLREAVGGCQDFTNVERELTLPLGMTPIVIPAVNHLLGSSLIPGPSGSISLSVLLIVDAIMEPGADHPFSVQRASCERIDGDCSDRIQLAETEYEDGRCFELMPETASESWSEALNEPSIACFDSAETTVLLEFAGISFRLEHASFAGEWRETPLGIERGVLRGFLKESDADEVNLLDALEVANVVGVLSLSTFLPGGKTSVVDALLGPIRLSVSFGSCFTPHDGPPHYGKDVYEGEPGWWFYMNYTAGALSD